MSELVSVLRLHHIIPRWLSGHKALSQFDVEATGNLIYLPANIQLAASMGVSPHPGGHLDSYYDGISKALNAIATQTDPVARDNKVRDFVDAMRVALANGHLNRNRTGEDGAEADLNNERFFGDWEGYAKGHKDQIAAVRALAERGIRSEQPHLIKWSAILNHPGRVDQLGSAIANNPGVNITSGDQDLDGTPFARFSAVGPIPGLPPSSSLNTNDVRPLPGYLPQRDTFGVPNRTAPQAVPPLRGFTPSDPIPQLPGSPLPQTGVGGPQILAQSPAQVVSDDFAAASQAMLNGTFATRREPGLESGDGVFALLPALMLAAPTVAPAVASAASLLARAAVGGGELATAAGVPAWLARAAAGAGLFASPAPAAVTDVPAGSRTPNQIVSDDFQSLDTSAGSSTPPLDRSERDGRPFARRLDNSENQRRISDVTDEVNGGLGRASQKIPSTSLDRAAQLAGLPDGGINLGQRTPFLPPVLNTNFSNFPAVLRGIDLGVGTDYGGLASETPATPLTDENNRDSGGLGRVIPPIPSTTFNRAAQLARLPNGGFTLGQRTSFAPSLVASADFSDLPAVLRGLTQDPELAPTNNRAVGWQDSVSLRQPSDDDLALLDYLRGTRVKTSQWARG